MWHGVYLICHNLGFQRVTHTLSDAGACDLFFGEFFRVLLSLPQPENFFGALLTAVLQGTLFFLFFRVPIWGPLKFTENQMSLWTKCFLTWDFFNIMRGPARIKFLRDFGFEQKIICSFYFSAQTCTAHLETCGFGTMLQYQIFFCVKLLGSNNK